MKNNKVQFMAEIAIMAALSLILGLISFKGLWAQGGSVSLEMVPIFLLAFRIGLKAGVITGIVVGLLQLLVNPQIFYFAQVLLDYPIAFGLAGVAGAFAPALTQGKGKRTALMITGIFAGCFLRLVSHVLSGVIFFSESAPEGMNAWIYSIFYNGSYMTIIFFITSLVVIFITNTAPRLLHSDKKGFHQVA